MVGRPAAVSSQKIIDAILLYKSRIINETGAIVGPTHKVWEELSISLGRQINKKNIYTFVKCDRHNIHEHLQISNKSNNARSEHSEDRSSTHSEDENADLDFNLTLTTEEWESISPQEVIYTCSEKSQGYRKHQVLQSGVWSEVLQEKFWEKTRLPCAISFTRAKVTPSGSNYVVFSGFCKECESSLQGYIKDIPTTGQNVDVICTYSGAFKQVHTTFSKRFLTGKAKDRAIFEMNVRNISPSMYRRTQANELMNLGEPEPASLPSSNALRLAKSRRMKMNRLNDAPLMSVLIMKYKTPYQEVIQDIGMDRFFVHYWTPAQVHVYRSYYQNRAIPTVSIDATGTLVKRLERPFDNRSGHIFLYEVYVHDQISDQRFPVAHMLSERHDSNSISYWLTQWIRAGNGVPKVVICDQSLALLAACTTSFTQYRTVNDYIEICYKRIMSNQEVTLPSCFIRCDVAHTVKMISKWSCLRDKDFRVRNLYLRSLAQIIQSTDIKDVKYLLESIFTVALCPFEGKDVDSQEETVCEREKLKLRKRIATGLRNTEDAGGDVVSENEEAEIGSEQTSFSTSFETWAKQIADICKDTIGSVQGDHDNLQYLPAIVPCIIKLFNLLPLWSAIMVPVFGYGQLTATSSPVENSFNDLKNRVFAHKKLPLRVDDFMESHIASIEGTLKIVAAKDHTKGTLTKTSPLVANSPENLLKSEFSSINEESVGTGSPQKTHEYPENRVHTVSDSPKEDGRGKEGKSSTYDKHSSIPIIAKTCIACTDGNFPSGAHICKICKTAVHVFPECSKEIPDSEEGHGQERVCLSCYNTNTNFGLADVENWRGLAIPLKKRKRTSYLEPQTELLHCNMKIRRVSKPIGILKNGNRASDLKAIKIKGHKSKIALQNTCAFDTAAQLLAAAYCDSEQFEAFVKKEANAQPLFKLVQNIFQSGITAVTYRERAKILLDICEPTSLQSSITLLSTETTIAHMVQKLLASHPCITEIVSCSSELCKPPRVLHKSVLALNIQDSNVLQLEKIISGALSSKRETCTEILPLTDGTTLCSGQRASHNNLTSYLFIELMNIPTDFTADSDIVPEVQISLGEIPKQLRLENTMFYLRGIAAFSGGRRDLKVVGHYVALCYRLHDSWEIYNDLLEKKLQAKSTDRINCQLLLYTI